MARARKAAPAAPARAKRGTQAKTGAVVGRRGAGKRGPVARSGKAGAPKYIYSFGGGRADGRSEMKNLLGGKGANLAEMAALEGEWIARTTSRSVVKARRRSGVALRGRFRARRSGRFISNDTRRRDRPALRDDRPPLLHRVVAGVLTSTLHAT